MNKSDLQYLDMTIKLAKKAEGKASPNPMVGAVIVKNNRIISTGFHKRCGSAHAEIIALNHAGSKAKGATLYINLEPCSHFGRTAPCTEPIIKSKIKRVVIGIKDPNPLNNGKGAKRLKQAGILVELATDSKKFRELNQIFIKYITRKLPFVIVKVGQSADGKIATSSGASKWITNKYSRNYSHNLRNRVDAVMVGINTVLKDNPYLSCRQGRRIKKEKPIKVIVDTKLDAPLGANIFKSSSPAPVIIATANKSKKEKMNLLKKKGVAILVCPLDKNKNIDLKFLMRELGKKEITSVLVEGGGKLIGSCFDQKLVDKAYFFIAPKIIGGKNAISSVEGIGISSLQKAIKLDNVKLEDLKGDILIAGDIKYS